MPNSLSRNAEWNETFRASCRVDVAVIGSGIAGLSTACGLARRGRWVVGFDAVGSIDEAEAMRDAELRIPAAERHALEPGAFYVDDLVGCHVRTLAGEDVGTVARVEMATGVPILVIGADEAVLVPLAESICRRVDVAAKVVEIDPPG